MKLVIGILLISAFIGYGYYKFDELTRPLPLPKFDTNKYWGPGDRINYKPDNTIKPFKVKRNKEEILDLQAQLNRSIELHDPLEGTTFEYGFNSEVLAQIVIYWRDHYLTKWKQHEDVLNELPQFTTEIQGLKIHFIHSKPTAEVVEKKKVLPLLLLHGWPGSVREFYKFIPILTEAADISDYAYEVVAPSLVGFGWSDAAAKPGFNAAQMAIVMRNLMLRLGYNKFVIQGGDWGSIIGSNIATIFPDNVLAYHSNMCVLTTPLSIMKNIYADFFRDKFAPQIFIRDHHFPFWDKVKYLIEESGYFHIQATKPDTIGTVLSANPIGLAAYILEKFQTATGPHMKTKVNALATTYTIDAVLDNVMIYYLSNSATSAGRFYAENSSKEYLSLKIERVQSPVPMGCARFKWDLPSAMEWQLKDKFPNYIHGKYFNQGGHFAAMEVPVMLYVDLHEFITNLKL